MTEARAEATAEAPEAKEARAPAGPPAWTIEKPTPQEAVYFLELRSEELRDGQHRLVKAGFRAAPDVETMREAFVLRYLASQLRWKLHKEGKPQP